RLAEHLVRREVAAVAKEIGFTGDVLVLGISVAALMHVDWLMRKLPESLHSYRYVVVPGLCQGELARLKNRYGVEFLRGPKEIHDLKTFLGTSATEIPDLNLYDIEIIAEINHAPQLPIDDIINLAERYRSS